MANPTTAPTAEAADTVRLQGGTGTVDVIELLRQGGVIQDEQIHYARRVLSKLDSARTLLEVLKELKYVDDEDIKKVFRELNRPVSIGSLLVELGHISHADLNLALTIQAEAAPRRRLGEVLVERKLIDERTLIEVLSLQMGFTQVDPAAVEIDLELFAKAPAKWYEANDFIPIRVQDGKALIAFADPLDRANLDAARQTFGSALTPAIARKEAIRQAIKRCLLGTAKQSAVPSDDRSVKAVVENMIRAAIDRGASDIHIEPLREHGRVRFRQDGVLVHYDDFSPEVMPAITNRLKVLCNVDIAEKRRHQGGRFFFEYPGGQLDLRASFYVTVQGEKTVLRLLNRQGVLLDLSQLGVAPRMLERFKEDALYLPSGVILFTGPTGSGKTTSVYSCINHINDPQTSIITAEEPVEYVIEGISQCSINPRIQLTFEETLRHIVRQDPDVIVIGEIRDDFSAEIAVQAALTGHKVLTTFHTEDSIGGLVRLLNMNIEAFLISSTVVSVMAQRLVRRICPECSTPHRPTSIQLQRLGYGMRDIHGAQFRAGQGCVKCQYTGFRGRLGIYELLILEETIRSAIIEHRTSQEIRKLGIESSGLVTLLEDGILKAASGATTIDELLRCLPRLQKPRPLPEIRRLLEGTL